MLPARVNNDVSQDSVWLMESLKVAKTITQRYAIFIHQWKAIDWKHSITTTPYISYRLFTTKSPKFNIQRLTCIFHWYNYIPDLSEIFALYILLYMHFSCIQHILLKFLIPTRTRSITIIHFHGQTKVDQFQNPKILKVMILDWFICHCGWKRLNFTLGNENAERYQW